MANASAEEAIIGTDVLQDHNAVLDLSFCIAHLKGRSSAFCQWEGPWKMSSTWSS